MLPLGQSVECRVKVIGENYVIVDPIREPEEKGIVHYQEVDVDLIVMGSRGMGGIVGFLGSTSQHVVEACTKPLIIVK